LRDEEGQSQGRSMDKKSVLAAEMDDTLPIIITSERQICEMSSRLGLVVRIVVVSTL